MKGADELTAAERVRQLGRDPQSGRRYAVGFGAAGEPYRAYPIEWSWGWRVSPLEDGYIHSD